MQILRLKGKWNEAIGYLSVRPHNMYNEPRSLHSVHLLDLGFSERNMKPKNNLHLR